MTKWEWLEYWNSINLYLCYRFVGYDTEGGNHELVGVT